MILERVYKVPNELKKLSQLIFFEFHDFSGIHINVVLYVIYGEYIEKTPISVDENFKKIWRSKSFSFIFSGKLPDRKILKVTKNRIEKKSSSMSKLKSKKGGANLPPPPGIGLSKYTFFYKQLHFRFKPGVA